MLLIAMHITTRLLRQYGLLVQYEEHGLQPRLQRHAHVTRRLVLRQLIVKSLVQSNVNTGSLVVNNLSVHDVPSLYHIAIRLTTL